MWPLQDKMMAKLPQALALWVSSLLNLNGWVLLNLSVNVTLTSRDIESMKMHCLCARRITAKMNLTI